MSGVSLQRLVHIYVPQRQKTCQRKFRSASALVTKIRLYNFDPLKPHFYIVKLGFTGVYIIFLILLKNIDCGTR